MKKTRPFTVCLLLASALCITSCAAVPGNSEEYPQELINKKISAIDTEVVSFSDIGTVCSSFDGVFDDIQTLGSTEGIYVEQLENKCTGFFNTYQLLTEDADEAIGVIGSIFSAETSERVTQLLLDADNNGALSVDEDEFLDVISLVSQDYSLFTTLSAQNSYFTVGKYTYENYAKKVETALFSLNSAFDYYGANTIDSPETLTAFKKYFSDSLNAMADIAEMHSETLEIMSRDGETVFTMIDRMKECLPEESATAVTP